MSYLPGLEPDFDVRQELRFVGGMPDLHQFDYVYISCSGGKDSHAMAYVLSELATMQNYDKTKMELIYADTGLEWHDTFDQVQRIGTAVGIKSVKVLPKYTLLDNVRRRWAKFNGLEWEGEREREREKFPDGRMAEWQVHSRTLLNASATATTNEHRSKVILNNQAKTSHLSQKHGPVGVLHVKKHDLLKPLSKTTPFPFVGRRWCTSEGKNNTIQERIRKENKPEGG